jgi:hypothetical protein
MKGTSSVLLLALCLLEGAAIMCLQLGAGSLLAPYFGSSLQTWAVLIGMVFTAFAAGYYTAAVRRFAHLSSLLLISGLWLLAASFFAGEAASLLAFGPLGGMFAGAILLVFVPVALLSNIPIVVTALLAERVDRAGLNNGLAFFISTLGGIIAAFATGFYLVPAYGPGLVIKAVGLLLALAGVAGALQRRGRGALAGLVALLLCGIALLLGKPREPRPNNKVVRYLSYGMLGQLMIADDTVQNKRMLFINGSTQAETDLGNGASLYAYVQDVIRNTESIRENSRVLVLGMGGGYLANYYARKGAAVDLVELDARIPEVAEKYFMPGGLRARVHVDDARHFINSAAEGEKYDLVIIDVYTGDNAPFHIITAEAFATMNKLLRANGMLCVYFPYSLDDKVLRAHDMMLSTLSAAGFETGPGRADAGKTLVYARPAKSGSGLKGGEVFTDNRPELELLLAHQHEVMNLLRKKLWSE